MGKIVVNFDDCYSEEQAMAYANRVLKIGRFEKTRDVVTRFKDNTVVQAHMTRIEAIHFNVIKDE